MEWKQEADKQLYILEHKAADFQLKYCPCEHPCDEIRFRNALVNLLMEVIPTDNLTLKNKED